MSADVSALSLKEFFYSYVPIRIQDLKDSNKIAFS
ncbi:mCG147106 [Mus musculus]|jgi:hypothetical protein|nr:mCG147106 [Mus musculus]